METKEIINALLDNEGISAYALAKKAELTPTQIYDLQRGKVKKVSGSIAHRIISAFPKYNLNWLLTGTGEMCGERAESILMEMREMNLKKSYDPKVGVPYYDVDFLGGFDMLGEDNTSTPQYMIDFKAFSNATCVCNISGDSMSPLISNGDMIILQRIDDPSFLIMGDVYALVTNNGLRTVKRLRKGSDKDHYTMIAENTTYESQEIPVSIINAVFKVMGVIKKL